MGGDYNASKYAQAAKVSVASQEWYVRLFGHLSSASFLRIPGYLYEAVKMSQTYSKSSHQKKDKRYVIV